VDYSAAGNGSHWTVRLVRNANRTFHLDGCAVVGDPAYTQSMIDWPKLQAPLPDNKVRP